MFSLPMFWQQLNIEDSLLNELVTKEDTTLDRVLEESDIIQECKTKNDRLVHFLARIENMQQLISYITLEPEDDDDEKTKFYKSYISCELLSSDTSLITDTLANDSILISQLWNFIRTRDEINPLLASFFSKVVQLLLNRRPNLVLEFLKDNPSLVDDLVHHVDTSAIMDLVYRIVICFENSITRFKVCHWLRDMRLIEKLVFSLREDSSSDSLCNTCQLLCDIIKVCRDPQETFKGAKDALLLELEDKETIQKIISVVTSSKNKYLVNHGLSILHTYLTKPSPTSMMPNMTVEMDRPSIVILDSFNTCISQNLDDFMSLLAQPNGSPFQSDRLQIVKLITLLVQCYSEDINRELIRLKTIDIIWKLFLQYPFNNFLHTQMVSIVGHILNTKVYKDEDGILLAHLVEEVQIMKKIEEAWSHQTVEEEEQSNPAKKLVRRSGYLGHVYKIATDIQDVVTSKENKRFFQSWLEKEEDPNFWQSFYDVGLKEQRDKNNSNLGPDPHRYITNLDSDDEADINKKLFANPITNPLFTLLQWKNDDDDDDFSFDTPENNIAEMDFKPVEVPEWKEKNIGFGDKFWEKSLSEVPGTITDMQVQEGSSSSEEEDNVKEVSSDPWANQKEFSKMDTDVSWANFNSFESGHQGTEQWDSTPPDGEVLHASPKTPEEEKRAKYQALGTVDDVIKDMDDVIKDLGPEYEVEEMKDNGMVCDEKLESGAEVAGSMITEQWGSQEGIAS